LLNFRCQEEDDREPVPDECESDLHDMCFYFNNSEFIWPPEFERMVATDPYNIDDNTPIPRGTRSSTMRCQVVDTKYNLMTFFGTAREPERTSHFYGRVHAIPPQQGIPGFQRIAFIKFCKEKGTFNADQMWEYEGCVLPGNRIIVGRWRHLPNDGFIVEPIEQYSGPFIFWNVDSSVASPPINPEEALTFLDVLRTSGVLP
jgi:hypothetical protein